jgi:hypothetical protein
MVARMRHSQGQVVRTVKAADRLLADAELEKVRAQGDCEWKLLCPQCRGTPPAASVGVSVSGSSPMRPGKIALRDDTILWRRYRRIQTLPCGTCCMTTHVIIRAGGFGSPTTTLAVRAAFQPLRGCLGPVG